MLRLVGALMSVSNVCNVYTIEKDAIDPVSARETVLRGLPHAQGEHHRRAW